MQHECYYEKSNSQLIKKFIKLRRIIMKKMFSIVVMGLIVSLSLPVFAADVLEKVSIENSMAMEKVKEQFNGDIAFYWGKQKYPAVEKKFGNYKSSKRTNAFGKNREDACAWAMASALDALQDRAVREGGNAVINIQSNIKNMAESSETTYNCLAGSMMVNVALKGDVVKLAK